MVETFRAAQGTPDAGASLNDSPTMSSVDLEPSANGNNSHATSDRATQQLRRERALSTGSSATVALLRSMRAGKSTTSTYATRTDNEKDRPSVRRSTEAAATVMPHTSHPSSNGHDETTDSNVGDGAVTTDSASATQVSSFSARAKRAQSVGNLPASRIPMRKASTDSGDGDTASVISDDAGGPKTAEERTRSSLVKAAERALKKVESRQAMVLEVCITTSWVV